MTGNQNFKYLKYIIWVFNFFCKLSETGTFISFYDVMTLSTRLKTHQSELHTPLDRSDSAQSKVDIAQSSTANRFFKDFIYLSLEEGKGGRKRGRETSVCGCFSHTPYWGPGLQPRHVPWLGIQPVTLWFTGSHSTHWVTPARANPFFCPFQIFDNFSWEELEFYNFKL